MNFRNKAISKWPIHDKLFFLSLAANNTWPGVITDSWPYNSVPQKLYGKLNPGFDIYNQIKLKEDIWQYRGGDNDLKKCVGDSLALKNFDCISLFNPYSNPYSFENKKR